MGTLDINSNYTNETSTQSINNTLVGNDHGDMDLFFMDILLFLCYTFILVIGTLGNCAVIYWYGFTKKWKRLGSGLVVALGITDCLSSLWIPFESFVWLFQLLKYPGQSPPYPFNEVACYILPSLNWIFLNASSWILVAISFQRWR